MLERSFVICHAGRANVTNGFTHGKTYPVIGTKNRTVTVLNDNGHERVLIPGEPSPHLKLVSRTRFLDEAAHACYCQGWPGRPGPCVGSFSLHDADGICLIEAARICVKCNRKMNVESFTCLDCLAQ